MELFSLPARIILPVIFAVFILIVLLWVLYYKNKKLKEVLDLEERRFSLYKVNIQKLKEREFINPEKDFEILKGYVRAFFKEYFNLDFSHTYLELQDIFLKKNNNEYAEFCKLMSDADYRGERNNTDQIRLLINKFSDIINNFKLEY